MLLNNQEYVLKKNKDNYSDENLTERRFSQEELLSLNRDNFKRLFSIKRSTTFSMQ